MFDHDLSGKKVKAKSLKGPMILSEISLLLMFVQSAIGLFMPGMYVKDSIWGRAVFLGNDLVNLFLFTPLLIIALLLLKRGSDKGKLFWLGVQALITYDYIYYPLGVVYNNYFLLYVSILGVSLYSFIFGILSLDLSKYQKYIPSKRVRITASILMIAFALVFVFLWIGRWIMFLITGKLDMEGVSIISTFDLLTLAVPLILSTIWLLKGEGRGYVLAIVMGLVCGFYTFILIAYTPYALKANLPDAWTMFPFWIFTAILGLSLAIILLASKTSGTTVNN
jgi:hypothetical protein